MFDKAKETGRWWDVGLTLVEGCTPVSEGCKNCWARSLEHRFGKGKEVKFHAERLQRPLKDTKPTAYAIWNDLYHPSISDEEISRTYSMMVPYKQHRFLVLTKRALRMLEYEHKARRTPYWLNGNNAWLGVTAENQERADERIPILLEVPAAVRFLSLEPLLGPMRLKANHLLPNTYNWDDEIDWVIIGCESIHGTAGRFADGFVDAAIDLVKQCKRAGVKVFVKQVCIGKKVSKNMAEWPKELRVRELPDESI